MEGFNDMKKVYLVPLVMLICGLLWWVMDTLYNRGIKDGMMYYHNACFEVGGFIINEHGHAIVCSPMGIIPKEELQHYKAV